jgi:hypothetical protein
MNIFPRLKRPLALAALFLALVLSGVSLPPSRVASTASCLDEWSTFAYYSDASYTNQVGTRIVQCDGRSLYFGTVTPYEQFLYNDLCCFCEFC